MGHSDEDETKPDTLEIADKGDNTPNFSGLSMRVVWDSTPRIEAIKEAGRIRSKANLTPFNHYSPDCDGQKELEMLEIRDESSEQQLQRIREPDKDLEFEMSPWAKRILHGPEGME